MPPFAALRAFEAVFRFGGIRKAAAHLGVNHAVVSRHLKQLEQWFDLPLVERTGHRLSLTEEGARYHARIAAAIAEMSVASEELAGTRADIPLRLWCVPGLAIQWISAQLAAFERETTGSQVELKPSDIPPDLRVHEADADIRYYRDGAEEPGGRGLRVFELARPSVMAVASPELAEAFKLDDPATDLLRLPFLHEENDYEWRAWLRLNGVEPPPALPGPLCYHAHLLLAAARQGRGVALATKFLVADDFKTGTLVPLALSGTRPQVLGGYVLIAREDRWSTPTLAKLRQFLRARAADLEDPAFA